MVLGVWTLTASVSLLFSSSMTCQLLFIFGINGISMVMMILLVSSPFFMICHTNSDGMDKCTIEPSLSGTYSVFPACKCNMAAIRSSWLDGVTHQQFLTIMHKWRSILTPQSSLSRTMASLYSLGYNSQLHFLHSTKPTIIMYWWGRVRRSCILVVGLKKQRKYTHMWHLVPVGHIGCNSATRWSIRSHIHGHVTVTMKDLKIHH